ncbi:MAG: UDP-2,3-diacylglucosamine diphosphatase [Wenzhouxiangella sp.]
MLLDFLRGPARRARALYILGDLFEVWIGDDGADDLADGVAGDLRELAESGVEVYFLCGNRDFLVGDDYCARAGMQRLQEPVILPDTFPATALLHGDSLCTDDQAYQRFRNRVRDPSWPELPEVSVAGATAASRRTSWTLIRKPWPTVFAALVSTA